MRLIKEERINKTINKLRPFLLPLVIISSLIFGLISFQGKTLITFKGVAGDGSWGSDGYKITAHIFDGLWFQHLPLTVTRSGNFLALDKEKPIQVKYLDIDRDGQNEILISGEYRTRFTHFLLKKEKGRYRIIYSNSEFGLFHSAFRTQKIDSLVFKEIGDDPYLQAVESYILIYANAPDQLWTLYSFFDKKTGNYEYYKTTKENLD